MKIKVKNKSFSLDGIFLASSNFTNKLKELYGFRYEY